MPKFNEIEAWSHAETAAGELYPLIEPAEGTTLNEAAYDHNLRNHLLDTCVVHFLTRPEGTALNIPARYLAGEKDQVLDLAIAYAHAQVLEMKDGLRREIRHG